MTTLFFSPFASSIDDPMLFGPEVDDDDGKPDIVAHEAGKGVVTVGRTLGPKASQASQRKRRREAEKKTNMKE